MRHNGHDYAVITARDLCAEYGERRVLNALSFNVHQGEIFVIMGPSGSGKSTLMRHLVGLAQPLSGEISLLGEPLEAITRARLYALRKRIGVAFQHGALLNSMSVLENIELPLRQHTGLDGPTIRIMSHLKLELLGLHDVDDLMPAQLSGGMLKRAGLARAVIMDPEVLFFDEPSAGLDPITAAELDELILKLRDAMQMTIVIVTHAVESAFRIADRMLMLWDGTVLATGTPAELRAAQDPRIQDTIHRRAGAKRINADDYLNRLTSGT